MTVATNPAIKGLMNTTISVQLVTGLSHGDEVLDTLVTGIPAYVEEIQEYVVDSEGKDQLAKHFIMTSYPLTSSHRIWLADGDTSKLEQSKRPFIVGSYNNPEKRVATTSHFEVKTG